MTYEPTRAQIDAAKARQIAARRGAARAAQWRAERAAAERVAAAELRAEAAARATHTTLADVIGARTLAERDQALALQRNRKA